MQPHYHIGCSGYYYPYWKNKFYPKGTAPKDWLAYYSTVFNTVELNGTFYRTPKLADLQKYARVTQPHFKFSVKMSRYISHVLKLNDAKQQVKDFQDLVVEGLGDKLGCFLFQMPPSFHYSDENLERILETIPQHPHNVVELRHSSWWNDTVQHAFKKAKLSFCNVDFPGLEVHFMHSTNTFYLRLHGKPELFKSSYSDATLLAFISQFPANCDHYFIYFNNTYYEAGYQNSLSLIELLKQNK